LADDEPPQRPDLVAIAAHHACARVQVFELGRVRPRLRHDTACGMATGRGVTTCRSRNSAMIAAHCRPISGTASNACGAPLYKCSSTAAPAPSSASYIRKLDACGTVASLLPWNSSVGGNSRLTCVIGVAARSASTVAPSPITWITDGLSGVSGALSTAGA